MGWVHYNPNPLHRDTGDCVVRAIAKITGGSWDDAFMALTTTALEIADMPDKNTTWGEHLRRMGYQQRPVFRGAGYTVADFCRDNPKGKFVLAIDGHVVAVIDGDWFDTADSGGMVPIYAWSCPVCEKEGH